MTESGEGEKFVRETVTERIVETTCPACGATVKPKGLGRPARYCSAACRQEAWALRTAEKKLGTENDRRPNVIRDVIDRHTERVTQRPLAGYSVTTRRAPATEEPPTNARGWTELLGQLERQLRDPMSPVASAFFDHKRLFRALDHAAGVLGDVTPGGIDQLR
jgi:endogenous inhibitor of DNA gyrase (YacG/DUF329 family)